MCIFTLCHELETKQAEKNVLTTVICYNRMGVADKPNYECLEHKNLDNIGNLENSNNGYFKYRSINK